MVMTYASPIAVHETISTDSVKESGASGGSHLIDDNQIEELDRTSREGRWRPDGGSAYCIKCRCCG